MLDITQEETEGPLLYQVYKTPFEILFLCAARGHSYLQALQVVALWRLMAVAYDAFKAAGEIDYAISDDYPFYTEATSHYFETVEAFKDQMILVERFEPDIDSEWQRDIIDRVQGFIKALEGYYDVPA